MLCNDSEACRDSPSGIASLPDCFFLYRFATGDDGGLAPIPLPGAPPQTPPQTPQGTSVRETRIVVPQAALLAISDAPPACFRHWRRQAPIPLTPSSLRAVLSSFAVYASQNFTCVGCATPSMKTWQTFVLISKQLPSMTTTSASLPTSSEPTRSSMPM